MIRGARFRGGVQQALGELIIFQSKEVTHDYTCVTGLILATLSEEKVKALANFLSHFEASWARICASKVNCEPSTAVMANSNKKLCSKEVLCKTFNTSHLNLEGRPG